MEIDKSFIKGFNHGFIMAEDNPNLLKLHFGSVGESSYKAGIQKGQQVYLDLKKKSDKKKGRGL